jgi:ribosome-binding factor A
MTSRRISRKDLLSGCAEPGPGDGQDPRYDTCPGSQKVANRKARQLCGEVSRTLGSILAGECADEVLRDLLVVSVVPAPNSSRLLVTVSRGTEPPPEDAVPRILEHLERARGLLRTEMAAALHRRRVPDLTFRVLRSSET